VIVVAPDMGAKGAPKKKDNIEYEVPYRRVVTVSKGDTVVLVRL
jgi:sporulation protein YlmC with PRC-barrel domain